MNGYILIIVFMTNGGAISSVVVPGKYSFQSACQLAAQSIGNLYGGKVAYSCIPAPDEK